MKLVSLNLEGKRHYDTALPFIEREDADIVALMETDEALQSWLQELGYHTTFAPLIIRDRDNEQYKEGIVCASKIKHDAEIFYYRKPQEEIVVQVKGKNPETTSQPVIFAEIGDTALAVTHFTWTPSGETPCEHQKASAETLLSYLKTKPAHILCGDMNIPRLHNELYEKFIEQYNDEVPLTYFSSLDLQVHRGRKDPELIKLFERFMVDYIFTQPPYKAEDVRLEFGVSDHAAVIGNISKV